MQEETSIEMTEPCRDRSEQGEAAALDHEVARIRRTNRSCSLCEDYGREQADKPIAILSCEGACLRGEISRQAANIVCHELAPDRTVRICLGGAFTKDTGQRALVRNASRVVALEGCIIECASRMMQGVIPDLAVEVIVTDRLARFDKSLFGIDAMGAEDVAACAREVAREVVTALGE
jgi:uncharacterized metal-binding protein